jgi:hypothetical protein
MATHQQAAGTSISGRQPDQCQPDRGPTRTMQPGRTRPSRTAVRAPAEAARATNSGNQGSVYDGAGIALFCLRVERRLAIQLASRRTRHQGLRTIRALASRLKTAVRALDSIAVEGLLTCQLLGFVTDESRRCRTGRATQASATAAKSPTGRGCLTVAQAHASTRRSRRSRARSSGARRRPANSPAASIMSRHPGRPSGKPRSRGSPARRRSRQPSRLAEKRPGNSTPTSLAPTRPRGSSNSGRHERRNVADGS